MTKIAEQMAEVLTIARQYYKMDALEAIEHEWREQKSALLDIFRKHPNWSEENLAVIFDQDVTREVNGKEVEQAIGQTISIIRLFYLDKFAGKKLTVDDSDTMLPVERVVENHFWSGAEFFADGEKIFLGSCVSSLLGIIRGTENNSVKEEHLNFFEDWGVRTQKGAKLTRTIGKLFRKIGLNEFSGYESVFARLADALSPVMVKRHTVISLHPCDFLTQSWGAGGWHSCHDTRRESQGCHSSGTISYMLDDVSFVFYSVDGKYDNADNKMHQQPKICREMFFLKEGSLFQSRLYPQGSALTNVDDYRKTVESTIAFCLGEANLWRKKKDWRGLIYLDSDATAYPDHECGYRELTFASLSGSEPQEICYGAEPMCIKTAKRHSNSGSLYADCVECEKCGYHYDMDDMTYIEGYGYVCESCLDEYFTKCQHCGEWEFDEDIRETGDGYSLCSGCFENITVVCEDCGEVYYDDAILQETCDGHLLCKYCYKSGTVTCAECGRVFWEYGCLNDDELCEKCEKEAK